MCLYPIRIITHPKEGYSEPVTVKCGKCLECQRQKSFEWALRIMDECSVYENNCFITLTYNNDNLPLNGCVSVREEQLFMKRLRKFLQPLKIRYFVSGEYGRKHLRPHYHFIIFNWKPNDLVFFKKEGNNNLYRSSIIERLWTKGFSSVGEVTFDTALYCAKYMQKQQFVESGKHIDLTLPFIRMSNRPGIGASSVYNVDIDSLKCYRNGKSFPIPRYYEKVWERDLDVFSIPVFNEFDIQDYKLRKRQYGEFMSKYVDLIAKRKKFYNKFCKIALL
ncbi:replication initiator protein [Peromfec virus RodF8_54]|uniref:Replication initiator protein n=1 Tax=Peromfec virus RodF8_54 TaxID=2929383 RepID=A0A976N2Z9_9VIRU|nr:replication initiator protein [Peromfec virus RodF8_54]